MNYLKIIGIILGVIVVVGGYFYPIITPTLGNSNPGGTTYGTSKNAGENLVTSTDTVFSILNTDASDRVITGFEIYGLSGAATSSQYNLTCGTSTVASGLPPASSYIVNQFLSQLGFGTTTGATSPLYIASTSPGVTGTSTASVVATGFAGANAFARVWPTNTYLNCKVVDTVSGANALNRLDAATKGFIAFPYRAQ